MGIFCFKKHLNSPRTFFKDLGEPEGFPHGLKVPRPRLKHGSCDELSRIFLFLFHIPTRLREKLPPQFHCVSFHNFTIYTICSSTIRTPYLCKLFHELFITFVLLFFLFWSHSPLLPLQLAGWPV